MARKTLTAYIALNTLFLFCAALHLFIPLMTFSSRGKIPTLSNVASNVLLDSCPLLASLVDAGLMIISFAISLPTYFLKKNITLLQIHATLIVLCALLTLGIGLKIWFSTLQTRMNFASVWAEQDTLVQSTLQFKFKCCGYLGTGSDFLQDGTCNSTSATQLGGCQTPFSVFANGFLDIVFTTFFGFCAVDVMLLLAVLCVIKERKEQRRYVLIDEKRRVAVY